MRQWALLACAAVALAGCQTAAESSAPEEPAPTNYRQIVAEHVRKSFFDPYTVRDASIAPPKPGQVLVTGTLGVYEKGWAVCIKANAKNRMGAYTGIKPSVYIVRGGTVVASQDDPAHYEVRVGCEGVNYSPFPEIESGRSPRA